MKNKSLFFVLLTGMFFTNNLVCMNLKEKGELIKGDFKIFFGKNEINAKLIVGLGLKKDLKDPKREFIVTKYCESGKFSSMQFKETDYGIDLEGCPKDIEEKLMKEIEIFEKTENKK